MRRSVLAFMLVAAACGERSPFQSPQYLVGRIDNGIFAVAFDGTSFLVSSKDGGGQGNFVYRVPKDGARDPVEVARLEAQNYLAAMATDDTHAYWIMQSMNGPNGGGRLQRKAKDGSGEVEELATGQGNACGLALDSGYVYWTAIDTSQNNAFYVRRLAKTGGAPANVATYAVPGCALAVDDRNVYWAAGTNLNGFYGQNDSGKFQLFSAPKDGTGSVVVAAEVNDGGTPNGVSSNNQQLPAMVVDAEHITWTAWGGPSLVAQVDVAALAQTLPAAATQVARAQRPTAVAVDGTVVYWVEEGDDKSDSGNGSVRRVDVAAGDPNSEGDIVSGSANAYPVGVFTDAEFLYWADRDFGSIYRARK